MTARDALHTPGSVVDAVDARLAQAALLALTGGALDARTGVLTGPGATALVTGTAGMSVDVAACQWVASKGASGGPYLGANDGPVAVPIAAAPASGSRIDVVWVRQQDAVAPVSPDATTAAEIGVTAGVAAASPTKPAIPVGATELATVTVAAGATATNGAGVTIANTARLTAARGAPVPVRSQTERDALTRYPGLTVYRIDTGLLEITDGSATWTALMHGPWQNLALNTGWTAVAGYTPRGRLLAGGRVELEGMVQAPASNTLAIVSLLPANLRPAGGALRAMAGHRSSGGTSGLSYELFITANGELSFSNSYATATISPNLVYPISGTYSL